MDSLNQVVQSSALRKKKNKKSGDGISNNRGRESKDDEVIMGSTMSPGKESRISPRGGVNCSRSPKSSKGKKVFNLKTGKMLQKGMLAGAFTQRGKNNKIKEFDSKHDRSDGSTGAKAAKDSSAKKIQR